MTNEDTILIVDDEPFVRDVIVAALEGEGYRCEALPDVQSALEYLARTPRCPLALIDVRMPGRSGLELLSELAHAHPDIAVLMISAVDDPKVADAAFDFGAFGYLIKPFRRNEIIISVRNALRRRGAEIERRARAGDLERAMLDRSEELRRLEGGLAHAESQLAELLVGAREDMIHRLGRVLEFRDLETSHHTERVSRYGAMLARVAGYDDELCESIRVACAMHDIGKIGIPDAVLLKEGHLTEQERGTVRKHAEIGHRILHGARSTPIVLGASVAWTHHERWDGSGYPRGLAGEEIPVEGRIAAIADVFDALTSARPWRVAMPIDRALATMRTEREAHFDPVLLDAFFASMRDVDLIRAAWGDPQAA